VQYLNLTLASCCFGDCAASHGVHVSNEESTSIGNGGNENVEKVSDIRLRENVVIFVFLVLCN
jgi:hypothetical protein